MSRSARDCPNSLRLWIGCMKLSAQVYSRYTVSYLKRQVFSMITFRLGVLISPNIKMSDRNVSTLKIYARHYDEVFFNLWMFAIQRPGRINLTWFWADGHDCPEIRKNRSPENEKIRSIDLVTSIERHDAVQTKTIRCQLAEKDSKSYIFEGTWKLMRLGIVSYDKSLKWAPILTRPPIPISLSAQDLSTADREKAHLTKLENSEHLKHISRNCVKNQRFHNRHLKCPR